MARSKPKVEVVADAKQAEAAMMELANIDREIRLIELDAEENIATIKDNAAKELEPHKARKKDLEGALCSYSTLNKGEVFSKAKTRSTPFGKFGWRKTTKLCPMPKVKLADVLERLRELGEKTAIRVKESVDKVAMTEWPDTKLEGVGMRRVVKDEFFVEVVREDVGGDE